MKRFFATVSVFCFALVLFGACGKGAVSSSTPASSSIPAPVTSSAVPSSASSVGASDIEAMLPAFIEAAELDKTIEFTLVDLTASGNIVAEDIVRVAGVQSVAYADNGGMVLIIEAKAGLGESVKRQMEAFRDSVLAQNEDYKSDYPQAYANLAQVRIVAKGDFVIYASSATGSADSWAQLDAAIAAAFA